MLDFIEKWYCYGNYKIWLVWFFYWYCFKRWIEIFKVLGGGVLVCNFCWVSLVLFYVGLVIYCCLSLGLVVRLVDY